MKYVWQHDGVSIGSVTENRWNDQQLTTIGYAWLRVANVTDYRPVQWEATVTAQGWYITVIAANGKVGEVQGSTFNLPLEVAAAIRRLL